MSIINDDFTMKLIGTFALFFLGFGGGGLLSFIIALGVAAIGLQIDVSKTVYLGAVIGLCSTLCIVLYAVYTNFKARV